MTTYLPALIWLFSGIACLAIAKRRDVPATQSMKMLAALLGPFAIPLVLAARPVQRRQGNRGLKQPR